MEHIFNFNQYIKEAEQPAKNNPERKTWAKDIKDYDKDGVISDEEIKSAEAGEIYRIEAQAKAKRAEEFTDPIRHSRTYYTGTPKPKVVKNIIGKQKSPLLSDFNLPPMGDGDVGIINMSTKKPVTSIDELKGVKMILLEDPYWKQKYLSGRKILLDRGQEKETIYTQNMRIVQAGDIRSFRGWADVEKAAETDKSVQVALATDTYWTRHDETPDAEDSDLVFVKYEPSKNRVYFKRSKETEKPFKKIKKDDDDVFMGSGPTSTGFMKPEDYGLDYASPDDLAIWDENFMYLLPKISEEQIEAEREAEKEMKQKEYEEINKKEKETNDKASLKRKEAEEEYKKQKAEEANKPWGRRFFDFALSVIPKAELQTKTITEKDLKGLKEEDKFYNEMTNSVKNLSTFLKQYLTGKTDRFTWSNFIPNIVQRPDITWYRTLSKANTDDSDNYLPVPNKLKYKESDFPIAKAEEIEENFISMADKLKDFVEELEDLSLEKNLKTDLQEDSDKTIEVYELMHKSFKLYQEMEEILNTHDWMNKLNLKKESYIKDFRSFTRM